MKIYQANWNQSGASAPTDTFLMNTIGNRVLERDSAGNYSIVFDYDVQDLNKVFITIKEIDLNDGFVYEFMRSNLNGKLRVDINSKSCSTSGEFIIEGNSDDCMPPSRPFPIKIEVFE